MPKGSLSPAVSQRKPRKKRKRLTAVKPPPEGTRKGKELATAQQRRKHKGERVLAQARADAIPLLLPNATPEHIAHHQELAQRERNQAGHPVCSSTTSKGKPCTSPVVHGYLTCTHHHPPDATPQPDALQEHNDSFSFKAKVRQQQELLASNDTQNVDFELSIVRSLLDDISQSVEHAPSAFVKNPATGKKERVRLLPTETIECVRKLSSTSADITERRQRLQENTALARIDKVLICITNAMEAIPLDARSTFISRFAVELEAEGLCADGEVSSLARTAIQRA